MSNSKIVQAHGSKVVLLDDYRPHVAERQRCAECGRVQISVHLASLNVARWECTHCGVEAAQAEPQTQERGP